MKAVIPMLIAAILYGCASDSGWKLQTFAFPTSDNSPTNDSQPGATSIRRVSVSPPFQSRSFTYRISDDGYEHDPYAAFLTAPELALAAPIRGWMSQGGAFGRVLQPESGVTPTAVVEVSVNQLCGDFRNRSKPVGVLELHFVIYNIKEATPGRVVLDKVYLRESPLAPKTPAALMAAWQNDLRSIMQEVNSDYAKAKSQDQTDDQR